MHETDDMSEHEKLTVKKHGSMGDLDSDSHNDESTCQEVDTSVMSTISLNGLTTLATTEGGVRANQMDRCRSQPHKTSLTSGTSNARRQGKEDNQPGQNKDGGDKVQQVSHTTKPEPQQVLSSIGIAKNHKILAQSQELVYKEKTLITSGRDEIPS